MKIQKTIKFRVWDEKYRCWVNNSFLLYPKEEIKIQGRILTQFTGLKDKNGKEIYEGDIIKQYREYDESYNIEVIFAEGRFIPLVKVEYGYNTIDKFNKEYYEVVGNIFENPELLNEKI